MNAMFPATAGGGSGMIPTDMTAAMRLAEMMSTGRLSRRICKSRRGTA